jgi:hypothetical protein
MPMPQAAARTIKGNKTSNERGIAMSLPWAELISFWSNWVLIVALIIGVAATYGIVVSGNVKESHLPCQSVRTCPYSVDERSGIGTKQSQLVRISGRRYPRRRRRGTVIASTLYGRYAP